MTDRRITRRDFMRDGTVAAAGAAVALDAAGSIQAAEDKPKPAKPAEAKKKLRVLVVTGGHGYDKKRFPKTFDGHDDIEFKIQGGSPFENISNWEYDVMVLYNFKQKISETQRANFLKLLKDGMGLVVMHHAIAAYPGWREFEKIIGATYVLEAVERDGVKYARPVWKHGVDMKIHVEDASHPITKGLADFEVKDETYKKWVYHPGNHLLLSTENKLSNKQIAWARFYGKARVFFIQLGHGPHVFSDKSYRRVIAQAIRWSAGRLPAAAPPVRRRSRPPATTKPAPPTATRSSR